MSSEGSIIKEISYSIDATDISCLRSRITNIILPINNIVVNLSCPQNLLTALPLLTNNCKTINCKENRIKNIDSLPQELEYLNFTRNRIQIFDFNILPNTLTYLNISNNFIKNVTYLPPNLETFICCNNKISSINTHLPTRLKVFKCCKNYLTSLPEVPDTIEILACKSNNLTHLPNSLMNCQNLVNLNYEKNERITVSEEFLEFIDQAFQRRREIEERERIRRMREIREEIPGVQAQDYHIRDIYRDGQNVHDSQITKEMKNNLEKLMKTRLILRTLEGCLVDFEGFLRDNNLNITGDSSTYSTPSHKIKYLCSIEHKHSQLGVNFSDIFIRVWNRIKMSPFQKEIATILVNDLTEMMTVCFTGRLSRLVNCLAGFDDEIRVGISENQQIQAKYNLIFKKLSRSLDPDTIQYNITFKYELKKLLKEIEVDDNTIDIWIEPFHTEIEDYVKKIDERLIKSLKDTINPDYFNNFICDYNLYHLLDVKCSP